MTPTAIIFKKNLLPYIVTTKIKIIVRRAHKNFCLFSDLTKFPNNPRKILKAIKL